QEDHQPPGKACGDAIAINDVIFHSLRWRNALRVDQKSMAVYSHWGAGKESDPIFVLDYLEGISFIRKNRFDFSDLVVVVFSHNGDPKDVVYFRIMQARKELRVNQAAVCGEYRARRWPADWQRCPVQVAYAFVDNFAGGPVIDRKRYVHCRIVDVAYGIGTADPQHFFIRFIDWAANQCVFFFSEIRIHQWSGFNLVVVVVGRVQ